MEIYNRLGTARAVQGFLYWHGTGRVKKAPKANVIVRQWDSRFPLSFFVKFPKTMIELDILFPFISNISYNNSGLHLKMVLLAIKFLSMDFIGWAQ